MELSQLRAFVAVSRAGTIAAAADALHVTSSPLSRTIRDLERQLGGDLFTRRYHQFQRTAFGDEMLPLAVEIIAQADEMSRQQGEAHRPLRIGATPWTSRRLTARFQEAAATAAGAQAEFSSDLSSVLLEALRHGDLDMALVHLPTDLRGITDLTLARYRYSVWGHSDRLATDRPLALADLAGEHLITLPLMMQPVPMARMLATIRDAGVASIEQVDLRDMIGVQSRLDRTGELMLVCTSDDLPTSRFFDYEEAQLYPLAEGELDFYVGLAWRTRDSVSRERVDAVAESLRPASAAIPFIE